MLEKPEVQSCNFCELQKRISKIVRAGRPVTNFYGQKELVNQKFQVVQTNQTIVFWYLDTVVCRVYFYSFNEPEIKELLKMAPQDAVLDILSRKPGEKVKWESVTGFPVYAVYGRVGHSIVGAKEERERFLSCLKELELTVTGLRGYNEAIITKGGVSVKEIDPF